MKTLGQIESEIAEGMGRFEQEYMGRGPTDVRAHVIGELVVVRLRGVLTAAEQHLVKSLPAERGRDLPEASAHPPDRNRPPHAGRDGRGHHR